MDAAKRAKLQATGWQVGSAEEFLGLTTEEAELVEVRLRLSGALRGRTGTAEGNAGCSGQEAGIEPVAGGQD